MSSRKSHTRHMGESMKSQKVAEREYHGLHNQGATCYLNSILQVLFMTPEIHDRLEPESHAVDKELKKLFNNLKEATSETKKITRSLDITNVYQQRDAGECLEKILRNVSPAVSMVFQGALKHTTKCSDHHIINEEENPFWTLLISLKDAIDETLNVKSCFRDIFKTESFNGNTVYCPDCDNKTGATSRCKISRVPQFLIVLLKRFESGHIPGSIVKSNRLVEVPRVLKKKKKTFELYGIVNHLGSLQGGHYTASIQSRENNTWYEFNDTQVTKLEEQPFLNTETYKSTAAYLLVYRATQNLKPEEKDQDQDHIECVDQQAGDNKKTINKGRETHGEEITSSEQNEEQKEHRTQMEITKLDNGGEKVRNNMKSIKENSGVHREESKPLVPQYQNPTEPQDRNNHNKAKKERRFLLIAITVIVLLLIFVIFMTAIFS